MPAVHPVAEEAAPVEAPGRVPLRVRLATVGAIVLPVLGLGAAAVFLWGCGFTWTDFGLLVGMYLLTALGITVGFHRLFVHRSFDTPVGGQGGPGGARVDGRPGVPAHLGGGPPPAPPAQRHAR